MDLIGSGFVSRNDIKYFSMGQIGKKLAFYIKWWALCSFRFDLWLFV